MKKGDRRALAAAFNTLLSRDVQKETPIPHKPSPPIELIPHWTASQRHESFDLQQTEGSQHLISIATARSSSPQALPLGQQPRRSSKGSCFRTFSVARMTQSRAGPARLLDAALAKPSLQVR